MRRLTFLFVRVEGPVCYYVILSDMSVFSKVFA